MEKDITKAAAEAAEGKLFDNWFDPIESNLRGRVRGFLETMIEEELAVALGRPRYERRGRGDCAAPLTGHRMAGGRGS
jgi:hypothetical protein